MKLWHVRLATYGRNPMFPDELSLREAVCVLVHTVGRDIVLFCIVDDHVHTVLYCERDVLTWRARSLCRVTRHRSAAPVAPSWIKPVESRQHLWNLVNYLLDQTGHHGLPAHPALWTGSCFQDLIGARILPGFVPQLHAALPRLQRWQLCKAVGLHERDAQPLQPEEVRLLGPGRILAASTAALGIGPDLDNTGRKRHLARALTAQVALEAGIGRQEISWVLGCTDRHILRLADAPIPNNLIVAVRTRLSLEEAVAEIQARLNMKQTG